MFGWGVNSRFSPIPCVRHVSIVLKIYLEFKNRCVDGFCSMTFEAAGDDVEDFFSNCHLLGVVVPRSL